MKFQIQITVDTVKYKEVYGIELPPIDAILSAINPNNIQNEAMKTEVKTLED